MKLLRTSDVLNETDLARIVANSPERIPVFLADREHKAIGYMQRLSLADAPGGKVVVGDLMVDDAEYLDATRQLCASVELCLKREMVRVILLYPPLGKSGD